MDTQIWATLFGAGGAVTIAVALIKGVSDWLSGAHAKEKNRNADALTQRNDAWQERDAERDRALAERERADREHRARRKTEEYASELRVMLLERGVPRNDLPPWPDSFFPTYRRRDGDRNE